MYGIYANIGGILMGSMLPYIAAPWILWLIPMHFCESFPLVIKICQDGNGMFLIYRVAVTDSGAWQVRQCTFLLSGNIGCHSFALFVLRFCEQILKRFTVCKQLQNINQMNQYPYFYKAIKLGLVWRLVYIPHFRSNKNWSVIIVIILFMYISPCNTTLYPTISIILIYWDSNPTDELHVHLPQKWPSFVGKYTSMEHMGITHEIPVPFRVV